MMMTSMKRKVAAVLAAVSLMTVATGALADFGDADKDKGAEPRYKVGQYIELYNTNFHVSTSRYKILSARKASDGTWHYEVDRKSLYYSDHRNTVVTADAIESN